MQTTSGEGDPRRAASTRAAYLERTAARDALVIGTHFAGPTAGYLVREGDGWRLVTTAQTPD